MKAAEEREPESELPQSGTFGTLTLNADQLDALREIVNVAMGRAGDALSQLVDRFIQLPVPEIRLVAATDLVTSLRNLLPNGEPVTVVRQAFRCMAPGECFVLFGENSDKVLSILTQRGDRNSRAFRDEMLLDVGNLLSGATVSGIAEQLGKNASYSPPTILCVQRPAVQIIDATKLPWKHALVLRVNFRIEGESFVAHVLLFWPDRAIWAIGQHLATFLEGL